MPDTDTPAGSESLSIDEATNAYIKATTPAVETDQAESEAETEGDTTDDDLQASDEGEGEEGEGETEAEDQAEDGDDEPESEQGRFVADNARVRLLDGTFSTVAELKSGSLRNADYTQKTQEVAEQKRSVESQSQRIQQREAELTQQAEYLTGLITSIVPQAPPDIRMLDVNSPTFDIVGYNQQKAQFEQWQQHIGYLQQMQQQVHKTRTAEAETFRVELAKREWATLLEKAPELKDEAKGKAFGAKLMSHGRTYGYTEDELRSALPNDHRSVLVMRDAIKWRELQASKAGMQKKVEGRPPVTKGGKRLNPSEARARSTSDALTKLGQSGRLDDAVNAYLATQKR